MHNVRLLISNFISVLSGNLIGQIIGFLAITYLGRVLGPDGYGLFNFAQSYVFYFYLATDFGLSLFVMREYNQVEEKEVIFREVFSLKFYLSILTSILFVVSVILLPISKYEKISLYAMGLSIFFTGVSIDSFFAAMKDMKYIGIANFLKNVVFYLLCLLIVKQQADVVNSILCFTLGSSIFSMFLLYKLKKKCNFNLLERPSKKYFKTLSQALPLTFSLLMIQINNNFDIIYLSFLKDKSMVGYYSAAYKIINFLIAVLVVYFNSAYGTIAELIKSNRKELNNFINKFYKLGISFVTPITIGGICLANSIMTFSFGDGYKTSGVLFAVLMLLIYIRMVTSTYGAILIMGDKSKLFSNGVTIGALINVILNIALVPKYGAFGSAIATIVCETLQGIYLYLCYKKDCSANLLKSSIKPLLSGLIMGLVILNLKNNLFVEIIIGGLTYFAAYFVLEFRFLMTLIKVRKGVA